MLPLPLGDDLGIEACTALKQHLTDGLPAPTLLLDASMTTRVHTASLQLLCALFRTRREAGLDTQWQAASPVLREAARLLGLSSILALDAPQSLSIPSSHTHQDHDMEIAA